MKTTVKYCIYLIVTMLICHSADAATRVTEGETGSGAKYHISVPENWNGDLVVYAHGIVVDAKLPGALPTVDHIEALLDLLVQRISNRYGHTAPYSAAEVYGAFEELVNWVDSGTVPAP